MTNNPIWRWIDETFLDLGRQFRWSYLPPLMIYLAAGVQGLGLGRALLSELLARAEQAGMRKMIAVIGDTANSSSIGLHLSLGFSHVGTLVATGWKFGRWLDTVLMEKKLGWGDQLPPGNTGV